MISSANGYIEINLARLYYEAAGSGSPLILVHAGISDSRMWDSQFSVFAKQYKTIRYDARGYGKSIMPHGVSFSMLEDLSGLLKSLGVGRAALLGLSLGGRVALDFCIAHPEAVSALIAVAPGLRGSPETESGRELRDRTQEAVKSGDRDRVLKLMLQLWADGATGRASEYVRETIARMYEDNVSILLEQAPPIQTPEWTTVDRLAEILIPTLIVVGERDQPYILEIADFLERRIPSARKVVIRGAAHMVNMERPQEFNRVVLEFLASVLH